MTSSVVTHPAENVWIGLHTAEECVARRAQRTAHAPRRVTVVDEQVTLHATYQAAPILGVLHLGHLPRGQAILPLVPRACVLFSGCVGIPATPLAKPRIPLLAIRLAVAARRLIAARFTPRIEVLPRGVELRDWLLRLAIDARLHLHLSILAWRGHMALLDQPCHADVLLEIANSTTESEVTA